MIAVSKEKINRDNARAHSAKTDREPHRVCPTKLSKQELEDLYFAVMDTNIELKRTVNAQQENIKQLNTKLNRLMAAQRNCTKEEQCCPQTKAMVNEQRDIIADLKKSNDRMSERIRILNTRLCSARQFLKHNPYLGKSHCAKCCIAPLTSSKNSAVSVMQANNNKKLAGERKQSAPEEIPHERNQSEPVTSRTVETETDGVEKESPYAVCNENRCRTLMEELKQKIADLQEESAANNRSYSHRISQLESEMTSLRAQHERARTEHAAAIRNADLLAVREGQLAARLREADAQCSEISSRLLMERNKVAELEMRLKAAEMSGELAKVLEKRHTDSIKTEDQPKGDDIVTKEGEQRSSLSTPKTTRQSASSNNSDVEKRMSIYVPKHQNQTHFDDIDTKNCEKRVSIIKIQSHTENDSLANKDGEKRVSISTPTQSHTENDTLVTKDGEKRVPISSPKIQSHTVNDNLVNKDGEKRVSISTPTQSHEENETLVNKDSEKRVPISSPKIHTENDTLVNKNGELRVSSISSTKIQSLTKNDTLVTKDGEKRGSNSHKIQSLTKNDTLVTKDGEKRGSNSQKTQDPQKVGETTDQVMDTRQSLIVFQEPVMEDGQLQSAPTSVQSSETKVLENETEVFPDSRLTPRKSLCPHCVGNISSYVVLKAETTPSPAKSRHSDDSGYIDHQPSEEEKALTKVNAELVKKITDLQEKLDVLRIASVSVAHDSAGLKSQQSSKATDTKMSDADEKTEDDHEKVVEKDSKTSRKSRNSSDLDRNIYDPTKVSNEVKKESFEQAKDDVSAKPSPIHRANQLWAQYSGNPSQQKDDRIKFSPCKREGNSDEKVVAAIRTPPIAEDRDSSASKRNWTVQKRSLDERSISARNEIVDKIDTGRDSTIRGRDFKTDDKPSKRNSLTLGYMKQMSHENNLNAQINQPSNEVPLPDSLTLLRQKEESKQHLNTGVKINDVEEPVSSNSNRDKIRKRDSTYIHAMPDRNSESNNRGVNTQKTTRNSDDDAASLSLRSTSELCEESVRICSCPRAARRSVSVFRSCSGTLRFRTSDVDTVRQCVTCGNNEENKSGNVEGAVPANRRMSDDATAENTDHEISHLSDLPPEHDVLGKIPRYSLSPGERITTRTYTDSCTEPSSDPDPHSVSEGEVLCSAGECHVSAGRRSIGEMKDEAVETKACRDATLVSEQMEQALRCISEELARCRELLQANRPEAVVYSRDKSLLLTWKFYDQTVAMTRMRNGRVILFDFTTEYDAYMDERFEDYLKYEEMPIVICELNKQNCPFALCSLPFRDVLLTPNHRVDMSLALTVGPDMRRQEAPRSMDSLVTSDEVGVLDLWCMLRRRSSQGELRRTVPIQDDNHVMLDCRSEEYRMSEGQYTRRMPPQVGKPSLIPLMAPTVDRISQPQEDGSLAKYTVDTDGKSKTWGSQEMESVLDDKRPAMMDEYESIKRLEKLEDDVLSHQPHQSVSSWAKFLRRHSRSRNKARRSSQPSEVFESLRNMKPNISKMNAVPHADTEEPVIDQSDKESQKKAVTITPKYTQWGWEQPQQGPSSEKAAAEKSPETPKESIVLTIIWLALNEECGAMSDASVQRLYVAFSLLGRAGAEYETPVSLPKPRGYVDKCVFNFRKSIQLRQCDLPQLGHMGRCKSNGNRTHNPNDCIVFTVISEPAEDPLGLASCEDIGYAYLYLGDVLAVSVSDTYVEVVPVQSATLTDVVCGVLCVQVDGLELVRKAALVNLA